MSSIEEEYIEQDKDTSPESGKNETEKMEIGKEDIIDDAKDDDFSSGEKRHVEPFVAVKEKVVDDNV